MTAAKTFFNRQNTHVVTLPAAEGREGVGRVTVEATRCRTSNGHDSIGVSLVLYGEEGEANENPQSSHTLQLSNDDYGDQFLDICEAFAKAITLAVNDPCELPDELPDEQPDNA